jgi:mannose-6-phosphate isomerase-like protein (cupin superfamily)
MVVQGAARVTLDGLETIVSAGATVDIPAEALHRIENPGDGDLVFVEIQRGAYLGEDDIERFDDDYGRAQPRGAQE